MKLTQARDYLNAYAEVTDEANLREAIQTVCGTTEKPTFIITADDRFATLTIRFWINTVAAALDFGISQKLTDARDVCMRISRYQRKNKSEIPN